MQRPAALLMAKTQREDGEKWLPLFYHLLDTACVMKYLVNRWLPAAVPRAMGMKRAELTQLAGFLALVHDLGKATPVFQRKLLGNFPEIEEALAGENLTVPVAFPDAARTPHAKAGAELLRDMGCPDGIAAIVGAHHGQTECGAEGELENLRQYWVNYEGRDHRKDWRRVQRGLAEWAFEEAGYADGSDLPEPRQPVQLLLSGLVVMADWIASDTRLFPLISSEEWPSEYDSRRAARGLEGLHFPDRWLVGEHWMQRGFFSERFGFEATAVQREAMQAAGRMQRPGMMILEAPMGVGKTEAALSAAEIMMNRFQLGGVAFFLPSQVTSNTMFLRLKEWAERQPDAERLSAQLAHAMADLNEAFVALERDSVLLEADAASPSSALTVNQFFCGRKTRLLAELVVGTVDQLLMAGLQQRHVMLRHLGLAGKVVVVDECHAYSAYMNRHLDRALSWLGAYGVPVILLSATLPAKRRAELVAAYQNRRKPREGAVVEDAPYPLLTWTDGDEVRRSAVPPGESRRVGIERSDEVGLVEALRGAVQSGGCAGVIVNTVRRAQDLAARLRSQIPQATVLLDHSQFLMPDRIRHEEEILARVGKAPLPERRAGVIVVGSQVLEQSLDLDFDLLATDLCPMDLLLQRIGRLHRHPRRRPEPLREARCIVLHADPDALEPGAQAIYGEYLLMRSCALLPDSVLLPRDISVLVQRTYDETLWRTEPDAALRQRAEAFLTQRRILRGRAEAYLLRPPCNDDFLPPSIVGLMEPVAAISDPQARAAVREGDASIEVLMLRMDGQGCAQLLAGAKKGLRIEMDHEPDREAAREILRQRLRLPGRFARSWCAQDTIDGLERAAKRILPEWLRSPLLEGELFLLLDENGEVELNGQRLTYGPDVGLRCKEDEDADEGV